MKVVEDGAVQVLLAPLFPQSVAFVWVELKGVVGLYLHQTTQQLSAVLEMHSRICGPVYEEEVFVFELVDVVQQRCS